MHQPLKSLLLVLALLAASAHAQSTRPAAPKNADKAADWVYLDNGQIRLGVNKAWGAGIAWLGASGQPRNLVNHFDTGRLIQQSYYGDADGSLWVKKPWRWNPVQGGDYRGTASRVTEFKAEPAALYSKTIPRNWAGGQELADVSMEQWITLKDRVAHVRFRFTYSGDKKHQARDHEIPALFADPACDTLVLYDGKTPWTDAAVSRSVPAWPNEGRKMAENWAAYVDDKDFGIGAYVPVATRLTCYRVKDGKGACSYFAPLTKFAIEPGTTFEYDLYLTIGTTTEMRAAFKAIHDAKK